MFDETVDETEIIRNASNIKDFISECGLISECCDLKVLCITSTQLTAIQKLSIFSILRVNMKEIYESTSWGWDENKKQKELCTNSSRFLLLVNPVDHNDVKAFAMFRFEWDDEEEPEHPVLFCYELQIEKTYQRKGLGYQLMQMLDKISKHTHMWKTMLTCFKCNTNAMEFYRKIGFDIDSNSPSKFGHMDEDYEILSNIGRK